MRALVLVAMGLLPMLSALAAELKTDGLTLSMDDQARVTGIAVNGTALPGAALQPPLPFVALCDVEKGQFIPATVTGGSPEKGWALDFGEARAKGTLTIASKEGALRFSCALQGEDLPARGMLLRFSFPLDAADWRWHKDMQTADAIEAGKAYENSVPLRAYADLPEWRDKPALRMGYCNRNFCTVLSGPVGLCLAVPLDRPCIFRTAYDGPSKRLDLVYDFALSPDTRKPNYVSSAFDLYACDPQWGLRDALARYYKMYPPLFQRYVRDQGQWMAFSRLSDIDNANEFYFCLQEGAPEPEYDDKIGVLSTTYFTHAGMFASIPNYDPEKDPLPPYETQVAAMEAQFKRTTQMDGVYETAGLRNAEGKLDVRKATVYGHLIAQFDLDPELPYGAWTLKRAIALTEKIKQEKHADLDGFYYDGLSAGINYNTAHFKTADFPCLWDPVAKKPYLNNFYSSCEFARAAAELLRPRGQITMMNGAIGSSFFVAPWLDVLGAETGLRIPRESFNYVRTIIYHKPFLTLLKGNYEKKIGRAEMELFMKRCLAYGVFPGFFDWPPSGLGPGGRYWDHARYYERDRDLFRKYQPLCRTLALAGWEPVTHARSSVPGVFVERFGPTPEGLVWLTLLNEDASPHTTRLDIEAKALGLDGKALRADDVLTGAPIGTVPQGEMLTAEIEVPADGVAAIRLATPAAAARWRAQQAIETLDRGVLMRKVDAEKPPIAVHWWPLKGVYARGTENGKNLLALAANEKDEVGCRQWAMLFQPSPTEVKLHVRAKAEKVAAKSAGIRCRIAWVTSSFSHYEKRSFDLPEGTYDWKDFEFTIKCDHPLRAIDVGPALDKGAAGTLKIARISLSDAQQKEYVVDPEFNEWYEPVPGPMRDRLERECVSLRGGLVSLEDAVKDPASGRTRDGILEALGVCEALRNYILSEKAENGCRRVLRDLETIQGHLGEIALAAFHIEPPKIKGRLSAAPGETIALSFAAPKTAEVPVRTEITASRPGVSITSNAAGDWTLRIPAEAAAGDVVEVSGLLHIGTPGKEAVVKSSHKIAIVPPLEMTLKSQGMNPETGVAGVSVVLRNNRAQAVIAGLKVQSPAGWQVDAPQSLNMPAAGEATTEVRITPTGTAGAGSVEVGVEASAGTDRASARQVMLYIPKEANLLRNPGFEEGAADWAISGGNSAVDQSVARSGKASLRLENSSETNSQASQTVTLNQKTPCPILVQACSMAKNVSGGPAKGYSLYVDIYYTDGTPLYGRTYDFQTGAGDWQVGELYIEPSKPIRNVNIYLLLRGKAGKAYFDDVALAEDPRHRPQ